jgi:general secretion pathway protein D
MRMWAIVAAGLAGLVFAAPALAQDIEGALDPGVEAVPLDDANVGDELADPNVDAVQEDPADEIAPPPIMPTPVRQQPQARPVRRPIERLQGRPRQGQQGINTPPGPRGNAQAGGVGQELRTPGGMDALQNGETPTEPTDFNYNGADILQVVQAIARLTGKNFDVDPSVGNIQVTLITHEKIPPEMAMEVLQSVLATRGFRMVETLDGKLIKIMPDPNARRSEKVPLYKGLQAPADNYDGLSTHIVPIKYANPEELREILQQLGSEQARIDAYLPTNTLIITDTSDGIRRIFSFLQDADIPGSDTEMEIFTLEYTRAEVLAQQLQQVLLDQAQPGQPQQGNRPARPVEQANVRRPTRPIPGGVESQVVGSNEEVLRTVADERLNSLIVMATAGMMERVRDLVRRLDTPTPYESNNLHVYELLNADAELVEQALQPLIGTAPRATGGGGGAAAGGGAAGAVAGGGGGGAANPNVQPFERQVQITRYDQTNSLLVVASPQDYKVLEAFIARLDVPQRQVNVLATVMDVTINDEYSVGVDAAGITGNDGFGLTSTSRLLQVAEAANGIVSGQAGNVTDSAAALSLAVLGLGSGGGLTAGIFDDIEVSLPGGGNVKVPFVPVLFQAIETITDLEVLSLPNVTTVDNEEASVTVGQEVPFVTNQRRAVDSDNNNNNNFNFNNFNSIRREDVGVKLTVTPQISEGDNVLLDINLEISEVAPANQQIGDVNLLGPTTNKSLVENRVLVKDGSTAVLAGLLRDTTSRARTQAPVLGDVPVLGLLFRGRSVNQRKQNLVALVTPNIVKDNVDLERVTHFTIDEYQRANVEEFFQKGFFDKIKKRRQDRKTHRPAQEHAEQVLGQNVTSGGKYGRGDIKR